MPRKTISERFEERRLLIFNSSKPEISEKLAKYGVDNAFLKQGEELFQESLDWYEKQKIEKQEKSLAYDKYFELKEECESIADTVHKIVQMAARSDSDLQNRLQLWAPISERVEDWINQTLSFYNKILFEEEFLARISRYGLTADVLNDHKADLQQLRILRNEAIAEKGQAEEATRIRNEKIDQLADYCYELKTLAEIALKDEPQLLEVVGVKVAS